MCRLLTRKKERKAYQLIPESQICILVFCHSLMDTRSKMCTEQDNNKEMTS